MVQNMLLSILLSVTLTMIRHQYLEKSRILSIYKKKQTLFILTPLIPSHFNSHFHAYEVKLDQDQVLIYMQDELADYHPLYISKSFCTSSPLFVRLKYHIE